MAAMRKVGVGFLSRAFSQASALVLAIIAARLLSKDAFGVYAIASAFVILLQALMYGGVYDFIIKDRSRDDILDTCFWMNMLFGAVGAIVVAGLSFVMGALTHHPEVTALMLCLAPSAIVAAITTWQEAVLLRGDRLGTYYVMCIVVDLLANGCALVMFFHGEGLMSLVVYRYAQVGLAGLGYAVVVRRMPRLAWRRDVARAAWRFAVNVYVSRTAAIVASYSGDILIGILASPSAAGAYRLGSRVVLGISEIAYQPVMTMAWVHFSRARGDRDVLRREWLTLLKVLTFTAWPALIGLFIYGRTVLVVVVGPGWDAALPVIDILVFARIAAAFDVFLEPMLGALDRTHLILRIRTAGSVAVVGLLVLTASFGAGAAALAQALVAFGFAGAALVIAFDATGADPWELAQAVGPGCLCALATLCGAEVAMACAGAHASAPLARLAFAGFGALLAWGPCAYIAARRDHRPPLMVAAVD